MSPRRIGVRAMRQNVSRYLRRAAAGESFEVTSHGRPVALLGPLRESATPVDELVSLGRATRPEGDLLELGPPKPARLAIRLSVALDEQRGERL